MRFATGQLDKLRCLKGTIKCEAVPDLIRKRFGELLHMHIVTKSRSLFCLMTGYSVLCFERLSSLESGWWLLRQAGDLTYDFVHL
jgi:hypothetical protein